jgi:branched-chain amino acid transport system substrate-binding protein
MAKAKAKPGTPEFRAALKDALETMGRTVISHGVLTYSKDNHWGFTTETGVMLRVTNGDWKIEP